MTFDKPTLVEHAGSILVHPCTVLLCHSTCLFSAQNVRTSACFRLAPTNMKQISPSSLTAPLFSIVKPRHQIRRGGNFRAFGGPRGGSPPCVPVLQQGSRGRRPRDGVQEEAAQSCRGGSAEKGVTHRSSGFSYVLLRRRRRITCRFVHEFGRLKTCLMGVEVRPCGSRERKRVILFFFTAFLSRRSRRSLAVRDEVLIRFLLKGTTPAQRVCACWGTASFLHHRCELVGSA